LVRSVGHDRHSPGNIDFFPVPGAGKFPFGFFLFLDANHTFDGAVFRGKEWKRMAKVAREIVRDVLAHKQHRQEIKERDTLLRVAQKISSSLSLDKVLLSIIESLRRVVPFDSGAIFLLNRETKEIEHAIDIGYPERHRQLLKMKIGEGVSGWVAKTGRAINVPDVHADPRYINVDPKTKSEVAVPIRRGKELLGVFNLESHRYAAFTPRQIRLLEAFAGSAAVAIQNARLYRQTLEKRELEKDLYIARHIQQALLPHRLPNNRQVSFAAYTRASRQVGGDFYDALRLADGGISIAVADVSGKSVPGALMMVALHTIFRSELRRGRRTSEIISWVNAPTSNSTGTTTCGINGSFELTLMLAL
jgi:sigma-B regulation protein RsbU (phosphoserine phosphatase)